MRVCYVHMCTCVHVRKERVVGFQIGMGNGDRGSGNECKMIERENAKSRGREKR